MRALGYQAFIESLPTDPGLADSPGAGLKAVTAIKRGTTRPDEWLMFVGHYDTFPATIYGAYDNGAGTNFIRYLAKEFADVKTNRSLVFVWYNGEENGVLASAQHAQKLEAAGQQITAVLGFDMVGIAWPVANPTSVNCLCLFHGANDRAVFEPLLKYVNYDFLGFPSGIREVRYVGTNDRNSDERSFANRGYRTMRWAGKRTAASYSAYHLPNDTIETIIAESGGEQYYEMGIENTLKSVYYTALALDNHLPVPAAAATKDGLTVTLDAGGSSDPDGALSGFTWDLGDGSTATGSSVSHTYGEPGTYRVTLTVEDNLWSEVTRSTTIELTVG
jgi:hypothetical protein